MGEYIPLKLWENGNEEQPVEEEEEEEEKPRFPQHPSMCCASGRGCQVPQKRTSS
jgi:hypothetical protein